MALLCVEIVDDVPLIAVVDVSVGLVGVVLLVPVIIIGRGMLDVLAPLTAIMLDSEELVPVVVPVAVGDEDSVDELAVVVLDEMLALVVVKVVVFVKNAVIVFDVVVVEKVVKVGMPRQMYCSSGEVKLGSGD
jgi:hypothetical protein